MRNREGGEGGGRAPGLWNVPSVLILSHQNLAPLRNAASHVICIMPKVNATLLQAKGICTGPKSDAQTTVCFELGDGDGRVPVSGLLLSVCAVRAPQVVALHMVVYVSYLPGSAPSTSTKDGLGVC